ncbi:hypothetical protein NM688_g4871 [Phlebia brevispora]|uniref:Uncharacterized protein n=1 Tax=Phlebia brevispora TaxID=194682 RepID=A0ACC1T1T1_9APHY|nr:hypothetical protein NM688_g4871 [Phlebia brevispora]
MFAAMIACRWGSSTKASGSDSRTAGDTPQLEGIFSIFALCYIESVIMSKPRIAIVIYTMYGHIAKMAEAVKSGVESAGGTATIYQIPETLPQEVLDEMAKLLQKPAPPKPDYPYITPQELTNFDGYLLGVPIRFGNMPAQWKAFWDATGGLWGQGALHGKYAGVFVSTAGQGGGQELLVLMMLSTLAHHGITFVPLGFKNTFKLMGNLEEVRGGSPWGAGTFAAPTTIRQPSDLELEMATIQGKTFYEHLARQSNPTQHRRTITMAPATTTAQAAPPAEPAIEIPSTMDQLVAVLISTPDLSIVDKTFKKMEKDAREALLVSSLSTGEDPLSRLDVDTNTLGWLYILSARLSAQGAPAPQLSIIQLFCSRFKPEDARLAPERITMLAKGIVRAAGDDGLSLVVKPLRDLVIRYPPSSAHLTNLHPIFLNACVKTRNFAAALPVLTSPIYQVDTKISELSWNDNLLYHYAGGVAFGALKRWQEAEEFFEICVTAPAQTPASIQLEALKKLTLVQLILYGKPMSPPKYTNQLLIRNLKNSPYHNLARNYPQKRSTLVTTTTKDGETFTLLPVRLYPSGGKFPEVPRRPSLRPSAPQTPTRIDNP